MRVAFYTLGCRVNQYESEAMAEKFIKDGYEVVDYSDFADVYVINTCTVTNMGDKKSRQIINRAKKENSEAIVAVVGCYSQIATNEVSSIDSVDVVLGTRNKGDIVYYVNKARETQEKQVVVNEVLRNKVFEDLDIEEYQDKTRAFLKIQDGCNRFCTYCLIPFARGNICSKNPQKVLNEVERLASHGFKEVILSGIHIASYGMEFDEQYTLVDLLEKIEEIDGIERVRIGSIEPKFFTDDVISRIKKMKKLCPHFHLSLQSGCTSVLSRMNRRYTADEYEKIVRLLRENIKDVSITTDVIVGFPGETDTEFNETYEFLKRIKLTKTHVFKYSKREGTKAAVMPNQVDGNIKEIRSKKLIELNDINEEAFTKNLIGNEVYVLIEQKVKNTENTYEGYTSNYVKVEINNCNENMKGNIIKCRITDNKGSIAIASLV
ncbi:MAG: tRNA (N(6)-L-threonylcarbamoyladenosine(37)-C(2))-methylthiotransferase MtaB [Clostridium sp.]|nr:tRNA (N(6)-L-threonylcarbamoyladenosine(37)-C(2))-methylthiotransferase MtaB [Clostridium sp.]MDY3829146.1 tRNA (N(6)-L-threonylcarbamoyladenosine(37)-C(2))-methylthiotransferase MtaB [Clostridium sp.]